MNQQKDSFTALAEIEYGRSLKAGVAARCEAEAIGRIEAFAVRMNLTAIDDGLTPEAIACIILDCLLNISVTARIAVDRATVPLGSFRAIHKERLRLLTAKQPRPINGPHHAYALILDATTEAMLDLSHGATLDAALHIAMISAIAERTANDLSYTRRSTENNTCDNS